MSGLGLRDVPSLSLLAHQHAVQVISERAKYFYRNKKPYRIYHGSTNSTRITDKRKENTIDTSKLDNVLLVDVKAKRMLVEPNVPMEGLVDAALKHNLVPPVIMEFPRITVGGGFSGTSAESSSFKHGVFDRTVTSIEIVLPNGNIVNASADARPDLFYGAASSFGTLGVTTLLELKLIDAKKYVELLYQPVYRMQDALEAIEGTARDASVDFVDGIMFSKTSGVICIGRLTDSPSAGTKVVRFTGRSDPWFYLHAQSLLQRHNHQKASNKSDKTAAASIEAIPLRDYLFRYDRGGFWTAKYAFQYFRAPFNRVMRRVLDRLLHTATMYHALHKSNFADWYTVQDVAVPFAASDEFLNWLATEFAHWPIWLCPLRKDGPPPLFHKGLLEAANAEQAAQESNVAASMILNFGVWGPGPRDRLQFIDFQRRLEQKVHALGGQKCLYAQAYYTEAEFYDIYDKQQYDALRAKYGAVYLPTAFSKVNIDYAKEGLAIGDDGKVRWFSEEEKRDYGVKPLTLRERVKKRAWGIWPVPGLYGVAHVMFGGDYLMKRKRWYRRGSGGERKTQDTHDEH